MWEFTEYLDDATQEPNGYYELRNTYTNKYIAPTLGGQVFQNGTIGVNLAGRQNGDGFTTIVAWDQEHYNYAGLKVENGQLVSCTMDEADKFLFARMEPVSGDLTTVSTVNNDLYGIKLTMFDYPYQGYYINGAYRQETQCNLLGSDSGGKGLVKSYLDSNGIPINSSGTSLAPLFTSGTSANHLFLQSIYNASGYFEYDSTQNYAYLNGSTFKVYDQLGTTEAHGIVPSMRHGQFFPYNDLVGLEYSDKLFNTTDTSGNELPESNPRKNEKMYKIPGTYPRATGYPAEGEPNYFFGMSLEASFTQTPNGLDAWGHDIIFEFSGDDDMWFFVDGYLILDLGGTHSAMSGKVNFRTGVITGGHSGTPITLMAAYEAGYRAANPDKTDAEVATAMDKVFDENGIFRDYTSHTMKMFYMERGAGSSNLRLRLNLTAVQDGHVLLSKEVSGGNTEDFTEIEYPFQIWYTLNEDNKTWETVTQQQENNTFRVSYRNTTRDVKYASTVTNDGITYDDVFFLKPGETADIHVPDNTIHYYIKECGVDSSVYDKVFINGTEVTTVAVDPTLDETEWETDTDSKHSAGTNTMDYRTNVSTVSEKPVVVFKNNVKEDAKKIVTITKVLRDAQGNELTATQDPTTFKFRISLGTDENSLALAYLKPYYVKDPNGYYCKWDTTAGTFVSTTYTTFDALSTAITNHEVTTSEVKFSTSPNGAIENIPAGYSVELRDMLIGTAYSVTERDYEVPSGYVCKGYSDVSETETPAGTSYTGTIEDGTDPHVWVTNKRGFSITANKVWSDADFVTWHDDIYFAVYVGNTLVPGTVSKVNSYNYVAYNFEELQSGSTFDDYQVYEVALTNPTVDSSGNVTSYDSIIRIDTTDADTNNDKLTLAATLIGDTTSQNFEYVPTYEPGTATSTVPGDTPNTRVDTISNIRTGGIKILKTAMDGSTPLEGAVFELVRKGATEADDVIVGRYTSNADGYVTTKNLRDGAAYLGKTTYTLTEIQSPRGYEAIQTPITITLNQDDTFTITADTSNYIYNSTGTLPVLTIKNKPFTLTAIKTDDSATPNLLQYAHFALYRQVEAVDQHNQTYYRKDYIPIIGFEDIVTGADGVITGVDRTLAPGVYYLTEIQAPGGYEGLAEDLVFEISDLGIVTIDSAAHSSYLTSNDNNGTLEYSLTIPNEKDPFWPELTVTKTVTGTQSNPPQSYTFTITMPEIGYNTEYSYGGTRYGSITLDHNHQATFSLADGETIVFQKLVLNTPITLSEATGDYTTSWRIENVAATADENNEISFVLEKATVVDVTNELSDTELPIVAPTNFSTRHTPWLLLLLFGLMLLIGGGAIVKRRRGDDPDDGGTVAVDRANTGSPGSPSTIPKTTYSTTDNESHIHWRSSVWVEEPPQRGYVPKRSDVSCPQAKLWMNSGGGDAG